MLFSELLEEIADGRVEDGTELMTGSGEKAIYTDGSLRWVTANGYESTAVTVNLGNIRGIWKVIDDKKTAISFGTGLELLAENYEVIFELGDGESYRVSTLIDLEQIILMYEPLIDIYNSEIFANSDDIRDFEVNVYGLDAEDVEAEDIDYYFSEEWLEESMVDEPEDLTVETPAEIANIFEVASAQSADPDRYSVKISAEDAFNILVSKHYFGQPVTSLANQYGITTRMVYYILDGTHWSDVYDYFKKNANKLFKA